MIFQVKDNGKPLTVAYSAAPRSTSPTTCRISTSTSRRSARLAAAAAAAGATVLMSNHSEFDNAVTKIKMMAARKPGEPHPFDIGAEAVARYFKVTDECAQVARYRLQPAAAN